MAVATLDPRSAVRSKALQDVIDLGEVLLETLPEDPAQRSSALEDFASSIERLAKTSPQTHVQSDTPDARYLQAVDRMQSGLLLVAAGKATDTGDGSDLRDVLDALQVQHSELKQGKVSALFFDNALLKPPEISANADESLRLFKRRAARTLDEMIVESRDVILFGLKRIDKTFNLSLAEIIRQTQSFVSAAVMPVIQLGVQRIIDGLKQLAALFESDHVTKAIDAIKDMLDTSTDLSLDGLVSSLLTKTFGINDTKNTIEGLLLGGSSDQQRWESAETDMSALSLKYVNLLRHARHVLAAIGVAGAALALTGMGAPYVTLGTPIAYVVVTVSTLIIGIEFAEFKMRALLESLAPSGAPAT